jgi:hypothetical protein
MKTKVAFSGHHEALVLLLDNNLGLDKGLLGLNINLLRLVHDNDSWAALGAHVVKGFIVELGSDHDVTGATTLEMKINTGLAGSSGAEHAEGHTCVAERFAAEHVCVTDFDKDDLLKLVKLLDGDLHVLTLPLRVFASIATDFRSPFLSLTDLDPD